MFDTIITIIAFVLFILVAMDIKHFCGFEIKNIYLKAVTYVAFLIFGIVFIFLETFLLF